MYQPENDGLSLFEIPTARETTQSPADPAVPCPDEPGRECMLRYQWAQRKNLQVKCATCGIMSGRVSSFYRAKKAKAAIENKATYNREYEDRRKADRQSKLATAPPAEVDAKRQKMLEQLDRGRAKQKAAADARRATKLAELAEIKDAKALERAEKIHQKLIRDSDNRRERKARDAAAKGVTAAQKQKTALDLLRAKAARSLSDAKAGKKTPSRVESVVMLLDWLISQEVESLSVLDFTYRMNSTPRAVQSRSGSMGQSLRQYGLTIRHIKVANRKRIMMLIDDAARSFVAGGYFLSTRGGIGSSTLSL